MAIIDEKNKLIFILIPKTGTTTLENFLLKLKIFRRQKYKHASALFLKNKIKDYDSYYKVAVVRNSFDWYYSWYSYRKRKGAPVSSRNMTFRKYLEWNPEGPNLMSRKKNIKKNSMPNQLKYLVDKNNKIIVDEVLIYQPDILPEIYKVLDKFNIKYKPNTINKNISKYKKDINYKKIYNSDTRKLVEKYDKDVIEYFNFKF